MQVIRPPKDNPSGIQKPILAAHLILLSTSYILMLLGAFYSGDLPSPFLLQKLGFYKPQTLFSSMVLLMQKLFYLVTHIF